MENKTVKLGFWASVKRFFKGNKSENGENNTKSSENSHEEKVSNNNTPKIPAFLKYPNGSLSNMMFGKSMEQVKNDECGYRFMLYTEAADVNPEIEMQRPAFDINEVHYYCKEGSLSWYSVCTMKDRSVLNNSVKSWVEKADHFTTMMGAMDMVLRTPESFRGKTYKRVEMFDMGEWTDYNALHGFDESHVYGHVFYLDSQLYKKFILLAKKSDCSWRIEVNFPSDNEKILPPDFLPAGQTFGEFYPI